MPWAWDVEDDYAEDWRGASDRRIARQRAEVLVRAWFKRCLVVIVLGLLMTVLAWILVR